MSLIKSIVSAGRSILSNPIATKVASAIPGIGTAVGVAGMAYQAYSALKSTSAPSVPSLSAIPAPGGGGVMSAGFMGLSPTTVGRGAAAAVKGGRAVIRGAANLCRKYPQWCSTIGGTVAIEALLNSGQLPMPKRRRGKGISAHELRAFKRVARFTSKYCAPVHKAMKAPALRRHRGATCQ